MEYTIELSISTTSYTSKDKINFSKIEYVRDRINLNILELLIKSGYCFCYCFNTPKLNQQTKTLDNWCSTAIMAVDIDDSNIPIDEYVSNLTMPPTIAYTTFNNKDNDYRFRLLYCFDTPINSIQHYQGVYTTIVNNAQQDNKQENKDNCMKSVNQMFIGTNSTATLIRTDIIYQLDGIPVTEIELHIPTSTTNKNKKKEVLFNDEEYIEDYYSLSFNDLLNKYRDKYFNFDTTPLEINDEQMYVILPDNYYQINRYWLKDKYTTDNGNTITTVKARIIKDGEQRKKKLFINSIIRRMMLPNITLEHILNNLVFELVHYINNTEDCITKDKLKEIAINAYNADLNDYQDIVQKDKRTFIINPTYCINHNITKQQAINYAKKDILTNKIGELYDCALSDKDNLTILQQNGINISRKTLYQFKKDNNLTRKYIKK